MSAFVKGLPAGRKAALISSGCFAVVLICSVAYFCTFRGMHGQPHAARTISLPLDVEAVIDDYRINQESGEKSLRFEGKRLVRRGKKFLGVRTTVVKDNCFENVKGTYTFREGVLKFSAKEAVWGLTDASPIFLKGDVEVTINDKRLHQAQRALIHLETGVVEMEGNLLPIRGAGSHT